MNGVYSVEIAEVAKVQERYEDGWKGSTLTELLVNPHVGRNIDNSVCFALSGLRQRDYLIGVVVATVAQMKSAEHDEAELAEAALQRLRENPLYQAHFPRQTWPVGDKNKNYKACNGF